MNKLGLILSATFLALAGCSEANGTYFLLRVEQGTAPARITKVGVSLAFAGQFASRDLEQGGAALAFPTTAAFQIGDGQGELVVTAVAFDAAGLQVASGVATVLIARGETREAVVTLAPSSGGMDLPDALPPANDGGVNDGGALDAHDAAPVGDAAPDAPATAKLMADRSAIDFGLVVVGMNNSVAVQISNNGGDVSGALSLTLAGEGAFALANDVCSGKGVMPNDSCTASVVFTPTAAGALMGELVIAGMPGGEIKVPLKGTAVPPGALMVSPSMHSFPNTQQGLSSDEVEFSVSNTGGTATSALAVALSGNDRQDFVLGANTCTNPLPAAGTCKLGVKFAPKSPGAKSASVTITGMPGGAAVASLSGAGLAPAALGIAPLSNNFGNVVSGQKSGNFTFKVTNKGGVPASAPTASLTGAQAAHFVLGPNTCTTALPAGGDCQVEVQFAPTAAGAVAAKLEVAAGALKVTADVTGTGLAPGNLEITPASHEFDPTVVGSVSPNRVFTVRNAGGANTGALSGSITGSHTADFLVVANACAGKALTPTETCTITLQMQPSASGTRSASLAVSAAPGGNISAQLSGRGLTPAVLSLSPAGETFGSVVLAGTSERTFAVSNPADQASGAVFFNIMGTHAGDFTLLTGSPGDCVSGTTKLDTAVPSCNVRVRFTAMGLGTRTATLNVSATPGGMKSASLSGNGLAQGQLQANAASRDFGLVEAGATSAAFTWRITNVGGVPSGTPTLSGNIPAAFVVSNGCTAPLAPNAFCDVVISFKPSSGGAQSHSLSLTATPGGSTQIALSGRGGFRLTVQTGGTGTGTVASNINGVRCPGTCSAVFEAGASVTLSAATENGSDSHFRAWGGACNGPYNQCNVTMAAPVNVSAAFAAMNHNLVFVSAGSFAADLGGAAKYDDVCNEAASKAGINTKSNDGFVAWLSDESSSPVDRIRGAEGWVRLDGLPVALTLGGLIKANEILNPIALDEYGNNQGTNLVFTGTTPEGGFVPEQMCKNWSTADSGLVAVVGDRFSGPTRWTQTPPVGNTCANRNRLYCFGRTRTTSPSATGLRGLRLYLSGAAFTPGNGYEGAVSLCNKGLPLGATKALPLLARTTAPAADALDSRAVYVTLQGERIGTADEIRKGALGTGIWNNFDGAFEPYQMVYTGSSDVSANGTSNSTCANWTLAGILSGTPIFGASSSSRSAFWFDSDLSPKGISCSLSRKIYCVEQP